VNLLAVIFPVIVLVNLFWLRAQVYGGDHWYYQGGAFVFVGLLGGVGAIYYLVALRGRPAAVLAEHRAGGEPAGAAAAFRAVASVQSGIAAELSLGIRWG
jgi:hypothetical protein